MKSTSLNQKATIELDEPETKKQKPETSNMVVIIGGGIIGLNCAYYLRKKGYNVTIIDKGDITNGCSFGNAGYVSPSHFTPLASPGIIAQGLRWMLSSSSPFYIKPRIDPALIRWGMKFWQLSNHETVERNSLHLNNLLQFSRRLTTEIRNELGNRFRMEEKGCLMLYKTAAAERHEKELAEKAAGFGVDVKVLSAGAVQALEPEIRVDVLGGVLYPQDAHLHPGELMQTFLVHLANAQVKILKDTPVKSFEVVRGRVTGIHTEQGKINCDEVIIAAGSWLTEVARLLGIRLLLQAGKGYSMTFSNIRHNLAYPAILVDDRVAMTPLGPDLRMGGTMEISGINETVMLKRARSIFDASKKYYPDLEVEFPDVKKIWSGLRPLSPDGLPYIGRSKKVSNVVIAGGHAMLGLSLAAGTGKLVEEIISGEPTTIAVDAFEIDRFN